MAKTSKNTEVRRAWNRITYHERCTIETRYCTDKKSVSSIARELERPTSAVSREIEGRLLEDCPRNERMRISYEAIYQHVYAQVYRGGNGSVKPGCEDLRKYLPRRHTRRQKKGLRKAQKLERDWSLPSIEARPKEVDEKVALGHWEGDTIVSRKSTARVKSINERVSGVIFFGRTPNGTTSTCDKGDH